MDNEKRYSTRIKSERCDKIKISSVAACRISGMFNSDICDKIQTGYMEL